MRLPTAEELRAAISAHLADPNVQASSASIAAAIRDLLESAGDGERCRESGCPLPRADGLETCGEHAAQEIATLRRQLREGIDGALVV